jgi:hypothetical protein
MVSTLIVSSVLLSEILKKIELSSGSLVGAMTRMAVPAFCCSFSVFCPGCINDINESLVRNILYS